MSIDAPRQLRRRPAAVPLPDPCAECEARIEAAKIIAASNDAIAQSNVAIAAAVTGATAEAIKTFGPVARAFADFSHRLDLLCRFLRTKGLFLVAGLPWVLWFMGVVTPEARKAFSSFLIQIFGHG